MVHGTAGMGKGAVGVWAATIWPGQSLSKKRLFRTQRNQVEDLHSYYNRADLAVQERAGNLPFTTRNPAENFYPTMRSGKANIAPLFCCAVAFL